MWLQYSLVRIYTLKVWCGNFLWARTLKISERKSPMSVQIRFSFILS